MNVHSSVRLTSPLDCACECHRAGAVASFTKRFLATSPDAHIINPGVSPYSVTGVSPHSHRGITTSQAPSLQNESPRALPIRVMFVHGSGIVSSPVWHALRNALPYGMHCVMHSRMPQPPRYQPLLWAGGTSQDVRLSRRCRGVKPRAYVARTAEGEMKWHSSYLPEIAWFL